MRIAFIFHDGPGYFGGPNVNARRLLPALKGLGHEVIALVAYWGERAPAADYLEEHGVPCRRFRWRANTEEQIRWYLSQIDDLQPDVFVPNLSVAGWFAARWVRAAGIPTIAAHRSDDAFYWGMVQQFVTGPPEWNLSGLVCVGEDLRRAVASKQPARTKLRVIPSGVPIPAKPAARLHPLRIVYIGRLAAAKKNIGLVVDSLTRVLNAVPHATADMIGNGPDWQRVERQIAGHRMDDRLRLWGGVAPHELHACLEGATAIVLLSDYEGTPGALMDAMACGVVPVCTDLFGGTRDLVEHERSGLVVAKTPEAVLAAFRRLIANPDLWQRLSQQARARVIADYSLDEAARRWEAFCQELVAEAGPRHTINIPRKLSLPPVHPDLAREDIRRWQIHRRLRIVLGSWRDFVRRRLHLSPSTGMGRSLATGKVKRSPACSTSKQT